MEGSKNIASKHLPSDLIQEIYSFIISKYDDNPVEDRFSKIQVEEQEYIGQPQLKEIKTFVKEKLITNLNEALQFFKKTLNEEQEIFDDIITLMSRFNRIERNFQKGIIEYGLYDMEIIKIENALLYMLNHLSEDDVKNTITNKS